MTLLVDNLNKAIATLGGVIGQAVTSLKEQQEIEHSISRLNFLADSLKAVLPPEPPAALPQAIEATATQDHTLPPLEAETPLPDVAAAAAPLQPNTWTPPPGYEAGEIEAKQEKACACEATATASQDTAALTSPDVADAPADPTAATLIMETGTAPPPNLADHPASRASRGACSFFTISA